MNPAGSQQMVVDQNQLMMQQQQPQQQYFFGGQTGMPFMGMSLDGTGGMVGLGSFPGQVPNPQQQQQQQQQQLQLQQQPQQVAQLSGLQGLLSTGGFPPNALPSSNGAAPDQAAGGKQIFKGKVKMWNIEKGFGFIRPDDNGNDVFVHHTVVHAPSFRSLQVDSEVEYEREPAQGPDRYRATRVTGPGGVYVKTATSGIPSANKQGQTPGSPQNPQASGDQSQNQQLQQIQMQQPQYQQMQQPQMQQLQQLQQMQGQMPLQGQLQQPGGILPTMGMPGGQQALMNQQFAQQVNPQAPLQGGQMLFPMSQMLMQGVSGGENANQSSN